MGYRILYSPEKQKQYPQRTPHRQHSKVIWVIAILLIGVCFSLQTGIRESIGELLLPGDISIIRKATSDMIEQIRVGAPVGEALTVFCVEIVDHGLQTA